MDKTNLGNRIKSYERESTNTFLPMIPVVVRIDGKNFSRFTKSFDRPFDYNFHNTMVHTTQALVKESNACIGYTQSDEITLIFNCDNPKGGIYFNGKMQKLVSVLASIATAYFNDYYAAHDTPLAFFDCRVFQVPNKIEACNVLLWRELDATKNSVSMAASTVYSHKELFKKHQGDQQDMLMMKGINWNDYPASFKRGTYVKNVKYLKNIDDKQVIRSKVISFNPPPFSSIINKIDFVFDKDCDICQTLTKNYDIKEC